MNLSAFTERCRSSCKKRQLEYAAHDVHHRRRERWPRRAAFCSFLLDRSPRFLRSRFSSAMVTANGSRHQFARRPNGADRVSRPTGTGQEDPA